MTVHLFHAPSGVRHSFVPKKVINHPLEVERSFLETRGVSCRVWNGQRDGAIDFEQVAAEIRVGDWIVTPLVEGTATVEVLRYATALGIRTGAKVVATSYLTTFATREISSAFPSIDHLIVGEEEVALFSLVSGSLDPAAKVIRTDPVAPAEWAYASGARWGAYGVLESSRGCAHNCTFCSANAFANPARRAQWRAVPAATVLSWLDQHGSAGARWVEFIDADFLGTNSAGLERAEQVSRSSPPNLNMMIATRADSVVRHPDLVDRLQNWGVRKWQVGVESADAPTLARFHKSLLPTTSKEAIRRLREGGADIRLEFIMFEPNSTLTTLEANLDLLSWLLDQGVRIQRALFNRLRVGRWSPTIINDLSASGRLRRHIFPLYDYTDVDPDVRWVFEALRRGHSDVVGEAVTLSLLVERLQDLGASNGPTATALTDLDRALHAFVTQVVLSRRRDNPDDAETAADTLNAHCRAWVDSVVARLGQLTPADAELLPGLAPWIGRRATTTTGRETSGSLCQS